MKIIIGCLCAAFMAGCFSIQQTGESSAPQPLFQSPLPALPESIQKPPSVLSIAVFILENGTVDKVQFMKSSGNAAWDSLAAVTIKQWRFAPARINGNPVGTWYHMRAPLHYAAPVFMSLAEIICDTKETADSAYEKLEQGHDFGDLVSQYSIDTSKTHYGVIGRTNIYSYQENIRDNLTRLDIGGHTKPIQYGNQYVIFKRLED
jgi:TonB family protein